MCEESTNAEEKVKDNLSLSEFHEKTYDRQIRLWGVLSQQRLMSSNVLLIGMSCINVEVAKNLALGGTSLAIIDAKKVTLNDLTYNYFLRESDIDKQLDECFACHIAEMNTLVNIKHIDVSALLLDRKSEEYDVDYERRYFFSNKKNENKIKDIIKHYSCVCVAAEYIPIYSLIFLDKICRKMNVAFFISFCCGKFGMIFSDMNKFVIEENENVKQYSEYNPEKYQGASDRKEVIFPPLDETLDDFENNFRNKIDPTFYLMSTLFLWERENATKLNFEDDGKCLNIDSESFLSFVRNDIKNEEVKNILTDEELRSIIRMYRRPFLPCAAVLGGILAQEIRKYLTKNIIPIPNCVVFNADKSQSSVAFIP